MSDEFVWCGATYFFSCWKCSATTKQLVTVCAPTYEACYDKIKAMLTREKLECHKCHRDLTHSLPVDVHIQRGTPESLRALGFPLPPEQLLLCPQ